MPLSSPRVWLGPITLLAGCLADYVPEPVDSQNAPACVANDQLPGAPVPLRRLNRVHIEQTVRDVFGVGVTVAVADERLFTYRSNVSSPVDEATVQAYADFAEAVADETTVSCADASSCSAWVLDAVAPRLFRHPLEGEQRTRYQALLDKAVAEGEPASNASRWVIEAMLQSPSFLYLDEPVDSRGYLDGYAMAARLSLMFFGANPDALLLEAAAKGELNSQDSIRARAKAMLSDPRSAQGVSAFVTQWLDLERLDLLDNRPDLAVLGADTLAAIKREPAALFEYALAHGESLSDLLSSTKTVSDPALTSFYGDEIVATQAGVSTLDETRRRGLLSLPGVMASLSHVGATSPTLRGFAVLANVMCTPPSAPPPGVPTTLPEVAEGATMREKMQAHFSSASCAGCHRPMDSMGFAFEHYDALGRFRALDNGHPVDTRTDIVLGSDTISISGATELGAVLAGRSEVRECFAKQWTRYATGIPEKPELRCYMQQLANKLDASAGIEEMIIELASSDYVRKGAPQ